MAEGTTTNAADISAQLATAFEGIFTDVDIQNRISVLVQRTGRIGARAVEEIQLDEAVTDYAAMAALMMTKINGDADLPEQTVVVEYLRNDQRMVLPSAIGMGVLVTEPGRCIGNALLRTRYHKIFPLNYAQIAAIMTPGRAATRVRDIVDALPAAANPIRRTDWLSDEWYIDNAGLRIPAGRGSVVMALLSQCLQFNCDIRDFGFLLTAEGHTTDTAWQTAHLVPVHRLRSRLQAYTLQCIAALNYIPVGSYALSAWVRAYGVSFGVVPAADSRVVSELTFVARSPEAAHRSAVVAFERDANVVMNTITSNIIALFGFFHLNKDHTFRTNDANMDRIGTSYIMTLQTAVPGTIIDSMKANRESVLRTAVHPFGLAQPYWFGLALHYHSFLAPALTIRFDVTPPPVQRVMIAQAASREWSSMPIGSSFSEIMAVELDCIDAEVALIRASPPAYSSLCSLYGIQTRLSISQDAEKAVAALMPMVFGYSMVLHVDDKEIHDGLALAMSLKNVERDSKGVVTVWKAAWEQYLADVEKHGLPEILRQAAERKGLVPPPLGPLRQ